MTVKEVFELRREGKIEEAYNTILPMYKVHHGKYTTLAMYWCAMDMAQLLLSGRTDNGSASQQDLCEAEKIYASLQRLLPKVYDASGACKQALQRLGENIQATRQRTQK